MKILLVEDNLRDRPSIERQIRQEFPEASIVAANAPAAFEAAVAQGGFALVLTGYPPGWMDGAGALDRIRAGDPDCPIIMIDAAGEDQAAEAMEQGFDGYLVRGAEQIRRLGPAAHAALARAGDRRARREAERHYQDLFQTVPAGLCECTDDGAIVETNLSFRDLVGATDGLSGVRLQDFLKPPDRFGEIIDRARTGAGIEVALRRCDGGLVWAVMRVGVRHIDGRARYLECAFTDITERKQAAEQTETLLREKNALIEELYHRVNNNLQIVMSFVQQLVRETADSTAKAGLQDLGARIYSLSLVQDQLYRNQNFADVDLRQYLEELCTARLRGTRIALALDLADLRLPIAQAIPIGLIANELLLNVIQHAFPGVAEPRVAVSLHRIGGQRAELRIGDNGIGMPQGSAPQGYGYRLIDLLSRQVRARVSIGVSDGTAVTVEFPMPA